ncbi:MAG: dihydropteroate synthase [Planctomycetota bacterium]
MDFQLPSHVARRYAADFPQRATAWRLRTRTLDLSGPPALMGIVNVTPDSFSDGGRFFDASRAVDQALQLEADGAAILDVGGESTRPYSDPVAEDEELRRVLPVVERLAELATVPISIDTSKAEVARQAIDAGAEILNDVTGLEGDPAMEALAADTGVGVCAMHMQGTPQTMQDDPRYNDVVADIGRYLQHRRDRLQAAGIAAERVCLDPGIGFGKTHDHNLALMANCWRYHDLGRPLLVGHSRKGFLAKLLGSKEVDRAAITAGAAASLAAQGVQVIRVHDVKTAKETLTGFLACRQASPG